MIFYFLVILFLFINNSIVITSNVFIGSDIDDLYQLVAVDTSDHQYDYNRKYDAKQRLNIRKLSTYPKAWYGIPEKKMNQNLG